MKSNELVRLRRRMDALDQKLSRILLMRLALTIKIIAAKARQGLDSHDPRREREILERLALVSDARHEQTFVRDVYRTILRRSVATADALAERQQKRPEDAARGLGRKSRSKSKSNSKKLR